MLAEDDLDPAAVMSRAIGRRVRASRTGLGWTLDHLAARSGVSRRMLINVEQGTTNPSIATLLRLAEALGIGLPALVEATANLDDPVLIRRVERVSPIWTSPAGGRAVMVAAITEPDVIELWDWHLGPADTYPSQAHRAGTRELLHVLSGTVLLIIGGTEHRLASGDSASFDGSTAHSYANASPSLPARFSLAVHESALTRDEP